MRRKARDCKRGIAAAKRHYRTRHGFWAGGTWHSGQITWEDRLSWNAEQRFETHKLASRLRRPVKCAYHSPSLHCGLWARKCEEPL